MNEKENKSRYDNCPILSASPPGPKLENTYINMVILIWMDVISFDINEPSGSELMCFWSPLGLLVYFNGYSVKRQFGVTTRSHSDWSSVC